MMMMRNILGRIFALWAAIVFIGSMLIVWIPIWLTGFWPEPKRTVNVFKIYRLRVPSG